ncbi:MAG: zinc ribbon domain-containing protein [Chloroflexota bacterium]
MKLRYLVLLVVAMVSLAFGGSVQPALAQSDNETVRFKDVALWLNPEYDDPRLLVMLEGNLDGVAAPVRVRFLVPEAAEMYSAGSLTARGGQGYTGGPPERTASQIPGWDEISYTLQTDIFRVEYYDPVISSQPDKTISYDLRTISPISNLRVVVQQPRKSSNFTVTPAGNAGTDGEGYRINTFFFNNVTPGAPLHFDIAYSKGGSNTGLIMGLILAAIVVGVVIIWMLKSRRPRYVPVRSSGKPRKRSARQPSPGNRFCTKCGEPAGASDKFCPSCGSKLRDSA